MSSDLSAFFQQVGKRDLLTAEQEKELAQKIIELADVARKNPKDLQNEMDGIRNWFLKDGVQMIIDGVKAEEIREMMEIREATRDEKESSEANVMKKMGDFSPAFGMVGTLIGLVIMMFSMGAGSGDDEGGDMGGDFFWPTGP